jgi:hypothetical protein
LGEARVGSAVGKVFIRTTRRRPTLLHARF